MNRKVGGAQLFLGDQESRDLEFPGGSVAVRSLRGPGKAGPNEDAAAVIPVSDTALVLAVADGVGGSPAGCEASATAVESLRKSVAGAATTPSNVVINSTAANCVTGTNAAGDWKVEGFRLQSTTSGAHLVASGPTTTIAFGACDFASANASPQLYANFGGSIACEGNYTISGGAGEHILCFFGGSVARLLCSMRSARTTSSRVSCGAITAST